MAALEGPGLDAHQVRLLWLGIIPFSERWAPEASGRSTWRVSFRVDGDAALAYPDRVVSLPAQQPVLIPPAAARAAKPLGDAPHLLVQFQLGDEAAALLGERGDEALLIEAEELLSRLSAQLFGELQAGAPLGPAARARADALVQLCVAAALDADGAGGEGGDGRDDAERQLLPVLRYVDLHLDEPLDNGRLAGLVHASESHFIRIFRRVHGCTPAKHVQNRRVQRAAELLAQTSLAIEEIAERCGFANRYHFSRVFAQRLHTPPGRYRALHGPASRRAGAAAT